MWLGGQNYNILPAILLLGLTNQEALSTEVHCDRQLRKFFFFIVKNLEEPRGRSKFSVNPDVVNFVNKSKISSPVFSPLSS